MFFLEQKETNFLYSENAIMRQIFGDEFQCEKSAPKTREKNQNLIFLRFFIRCIFKLGDM